MKYLNVLWTLKIALSFTLLLIFPPKSNAQNPIEKSLQDNINTPQNFPDPNFRQVVESIMNVKPGGVFTAIDIASIDTLYCPNKKISDMKGIEYFTSVIGLYCDNNLLTYLDLSQNMSLKHVSCANNQLIHLELPTTPTLFYLYCPMNRLTSLNLENTTELQLLHCYENKLLHLDLSRNNFLYELNCSHNNLMVIDISKNLQLATLRCDHNQISHLDVSYNTKLTEVYCSHNLLSNITSFVINEQFSQQDILDIRYNNLDYDDWDDVLTLRNRLEEAYYFDWVEDLRWGFAYSPQNGIDPFELIGENINLPYFFPDPNFRAAVEQFMGVDYRSPFTMKDVASRIGVFSCSGMSIKDVTGIELLTGITELYCSNNEINYLDISNSKNLRELACDNNSLTHLDLTNNPSLIYLWCENNELTYLNVSNNQKLEILRISSNQLTNLDITFATNIHTLQCSRNQLERIDVSNNHLLKYFDCSTNQLTQLICSDHPYLTHLTCYDNQLVYLDTSNAISLYSLYCSDNHLSSLYVADSPQLEFLNCSNNRLTDIDISKNTKLIGLTCSHNLLSNIDVSQNSLLSFLICNNNHIDSISSIIEREKNRDRGIITLDLRYNDLDYDIWDDIWFLRKVIGPPQYDSWESLVSGFEYSPQNVFNPYICMHPGDSNRDGRINFDDFITIFSNFFYKDNLTVVQKRLDDVNRDGSITPQDAQELYLQAKLSQKIITIDLPNLPENAFPLEMVLIEGGTFNMGTTDSLRYPDATPHQVSLTNDFYIGKYETTQGQWKAIMGSLPEINQSIGINFPICSVTWNECQDFINKLNDLEIGTFRLPTEAEWEYACRAGTTTRFYWGDEWNILDNKIHACHTRGGGYNPVGMMPPNPFGLYDISGNVWEWCQDFYAPYTKEPKIDPIGPKTGVDRVYRGGAWDLSASSCQSANRAHAPPEKRYFVSIGLRLVKILP